MERGRRPTPARLWPAARPRLRRRAPGGGRSPECRLPSPAGESGREPGGRRRRRGGGGGNFSAPDSWAEWGCAQRVPSPSRGGGRRPAAGGWGAAGIVHLAAAAAAAESRGAPYGAGEGRPNLYPLPGSPLGTPSHSPHRRRMRPMGVWWGGRVPQRLGQVKVGRESAAGWEGGGHMPGLGLGGMDIQGAWAPGVPIWPLVGMGRRSGWGSPRVPWMAGDSGSSSPHVSQ